MSTPTKTIVSFQNARQPVPDIWYEELLNMVEAASHELRVLPSTPEAPVSPVTIDLQSLDTLKMLWVQSDAPITMVLVYTDDSTVTLIGDFWALGVADGATVLPKSLTVSTDDEDGAVVRVRAIGA
jgi:hypothetical protein